MNASRSFGIGAAVAAALLLANIASCTQADTVNPPQSAGIRIPVSYSSPGKGFISLALYDSSGVLVRSLLYAKPVEAGAHSVEWDGATDLGKPAAPGTYTVKGIYFTSKPALNYVMEVGKSGNPPWRTPDGKGDWGGNLGGPASIVANGNTVLFAYGCVEDPQITGIQQMDGDGNIAMRYFSFYPWDTRSAGAMDATSYYLGIYNGGKHTTEIAAYTLGQPRGKILTVLPSPAVPDQTETRWHGRLMGVVNGMALTSDTIYATVAANNVLYVIDRASGQIRRQVTISSPHGVAVAGDHLLIVSGNRVIKVSFTGDPLADFAGGLTAPNAIAIDSARNVYVGDSGANGSAGPGAELGSRQVLVYSPSGQLLRKVGKAGGSPQEGQFDENGFGMISSLCIGPGANGSGEVLWVNDIATGFPRTSRWSLDGHLEQQWFARKLSLFSDSFNPANPSELIFCEDAFSDEPGISAYSMDVASKTWRPAWHYDNHWSDMYREDTYLSFMHGGNPYNGARAPQSRWPVFDYDSRHFVTYHGVNYFMNENGNGDGAIFTYAAGHKPTPVALVCYHRCQQEGAKIESTYDQGQNNWFTWADKNGDGQLSLDEITYTAGPPTLTHAMRVSEAHLDGSLNVIMKLFVRDATGTRIVDAVLPLKNLLPNGAPVYDWSDLKYGVPLQLPDLTGGDGWKKTGFVEVPTGVESGDSLYTMLYPGYDKASDPNRKFTVSGIDGDGWWASRNWRTKVAKFDKLTGKCLWAVGRRAPGLAQPGQMYHPCWLAGVAGGAVFVTDTLGPEWVWNTDGLYIGHIFNDFNSGIEDDKTLYGEIQATSVFTDQASGKIYSIANDTGAHIHEVVLPKTDPIAAPPVAISSAQVASVAPWDPDGVVPTERPVLTAHYTTSPPKIDGELSDWYSTANKPTQSGLILLDGSRLADIRVMYDNTNLYAAYYISSPTAPLNSGSELPYAPFVSGAYVDLDLAPNWTGARDTVRDGDVRAIVAPVKDATGAYFQQGFWQVKSGGANPQTISSPAAVVHFDQVAPLPGLRAAFGGQRIDSVRGIVWYSVELSIPLASLGLSNPAGRTVGFDASVGVANADGNRRDRAAHWAGLSEAAVVDRPGSARLLPGTWGTLVFAPPGQ